MSLLSRGFENLAVGRQNHAAQSASEKSAKEGNFSGGTCFEPRQDRRTQVRCYDESVRQGKGKASGTGHFRNYPEAPGDSRLAGQEVGVNLAGALTSSVSTLIFLERNGATQKPLGSSRMSMYSPCWSPQFEVKAKHLMCLPSCSSIFWAPLRLVVCWGQLSRAEKFYAPRNVACPDCSASALLAASTTAVVVISISYGSVHLTVSRQHH